MCWYFIWNYKILNWSKFKVFAGNKWNIDQIMEFSWDKIENILGNGENVGYRHFPSFLEAFQPWINKS